MFPFITHLIHNGAADQTLFDLMIPTDVLPKKRLHRREE